MGQCRQWSTQIAFSGVGHYASEYCVGQEHCVSRGTLYHSQESQQEDKDKGRSGGRTLDSTGQHCTNLFTALKSI